MGAPEVGPAACADDAAVDAFAAAMKEKLAAARAKGRGGWDGDEPGMQQRLSDMLRAHIEKGDPRDVANFAMFLHQRGETILPARQPAVLSAKPLAWKEDGLTRPTGWREWSDRLMGFHISYDPEEEPGKRYTAAWGEGEPEDFESLAAAQKWCQAQADEWVRECAAPRGSVTPAMVERATRALCTRWGWIVDPRYHADVQAAIEAAFNGGDQARGSSGADDGKDLLAEIELPHGFSVVEHLPGTWEYRYREEDGTEMAGSTSWSHPALAAIDAWQWYSHRLASEAGR